MTVFLRRTTSVLAATAIVGLGAGVAAPGATANPTPVYSQICSKANIALSAAQVSYDRRNPSGKAHIALKGWAPGIGITAHGVEGTLDWRNVKTGRTGHLTGHAENAADMFWHEVPTGSGEVAMNAKIVASWGVFGQKLTATCSATYPVI
ncbi:hypothetical protein [Tsukamurella sp. 1534]|uniref:hypothetical protein n=1 Tax=Tsukamurella sp. 1534 TaxID=1151061 RepID=UPI0011D2A987|nr:hypothetical protein [Tsukamurella sp. 1534]